MAKLQEGSNLRVVAKKWIPQGRDGIEIHHLSDTYSDDTDEDEDLDQNNDTCESESDSEQSDSDSVIADSDIDVLTPSNQSRRQHNNYNKRRGLF